MSNLKFRLAILLLPLLGCAGCREKVLKVVNDDAFPQRLSEWHLFTDKLADLKPNQGVIPYDLNTPLFSNYASKQRFVWMPPETAARYRASGSFDFPVGTVFAKTFSFPDPPGSGRERRIETRVLIHTNAGWYGLPYIWNQEQTEAALDMTPAPVPITYTKPSGGRLRFDYVIPSANQCKNCHQKADVVLPLGPKAASLNRDFAYATGSENQLAHWTRVGYLQDAPAPGQAPRLPVWDDAAHFGVAERARAYLDTNCGHCHNPQGFAARTGLFLSYDSPVPVATVARLVRRMESTDPDVLMPDFGRSIVHKEAVELMREWVNRRGS